jgi:hypothetical protein
METKKVIEVNLGVGMDQLFPRPVQIVVNDEVEEMREIYPANIEGSEEFNNLNTQENGEES